MLRIYEGKGGDSPPAPKQLPPRGVGHATHPRNYLADPGLVEAANAALVLRQPLLLTGEPGTGKTQFAASLSWELGLGASVLRFDSKSHSKSKDLFYTIDTLSWFQVSQAGSREATVLDFISYNALGEAILRANNLDDVRAYLPARFNHTGERSRSVVLIDEIDKAPRDFPNDLLSEIEDLRFRVPELKNAEIAAHPDSAPVMVITSNSERDLPDAFLRRCVYYDIPFPKLDRLAEIVKARLREAVGGEQFLADAIDLFDELRSAGAGLRKRPATAELLGWIVAMRRMDPESENPLKKNPALAEVALPTVVKTHDDLNRARVVVEAWIQKRR